MGTLDPKEHQVAGTHERRLRKGEQREERVTSQIELVQVNRRERLDIALIHVRLEHCGKHDARDPNGQRGVERSHGAAVVLDVVHGLAVEGHRGGEGLGKRCRVRPDEVPHLLQVARRHGGIDAVLELLQAVGGGTQVGCGAGKHALRIGKVARKVLGCRREIGGGRAQTARHVLTALGDALHRIGERRDLLLERLLVGILDR